MLAVLSVELRKLNRSLAAVLAVAAPSLIAVFGFFMVLRGTGLGRGICGWQCDRHLGLFHAADERDRPDGPRRPHGARPEGMGPSARPAPAALATLCGQGGLVLAVVAVMSVLNLVLTWAAMPWPWRSSPSGPDRRLRPGPQLILLGKVMLAATLMIAIQLWIALRFASFVPALALGIGGTFFSVVATSAKAGRVLPLADAGQHAGQGGLAGETALALGGGLGVAVLVLAVIHLGRREVL